MSKQELKKSVAAINSPPNDLTSSRKMALAFLVESGIVTTSGEVTKHYRQGAYTFALFKALGSVILDRRVVAENIRTVVTPQKAKSFCVVKLFHHSTVLSHHRLLTEVLWCPRIMDRPE